MSAAKRPRASSGNHMDVRFPEQMDKVHYLVLKDGSFANALMNKEVENFYHGLGLPAAYFENTSAEDIAKHVTSLQAAKVLAKASGRPLDIWLQQEEANSAFFAARSLVTEVEAGHVRVKDFSDAISPCTRIERHIEQRYLSGNASDSKTDDHAAGSSGIEAHFRRSEMPFSLSYGKTEAAGDPRIFRMQCYRSGGVLEDETGVHLRLYFCSAPDFANPSPAEGETRLAQLGDKTFLKSSTPAVLKAYQDMMTAVVDAMGPVIKVVTLEENPELCDEGEAMMMVGYHVGSTHSYFSGVSDVYRYYNFFAVKKFAESFSNGVQIFTFILCSLSKDLVGSSLDADVPRLGRQAAPAGGAGAAAGAGAGAGSGSPRAKVSRKEWFASNLHHMARDTGLHFALPRTSITPLLTSKVLSASEAAYAYCAWKFAYHFLNRGVTEYNTIATALSSVASEHMSTLSKLRRSLITQSYTEGFILDAIFRNHKLIRELYTDFRERHMVTSTRKPMEQAEALSHLRRSCSTDADLEIFSAMLTFNVSILKTNFYVPGKLALAFRLNPAFLPRLDYPDTPFGMFFVVGAEFRAFHIRFRDVARGGIRLVRSANTQAFVNNVSSMFDECYNLANTQQRKNKDIPEGGSKGVLLLNLAYQNKPRTAFTKFVDSMLDLMLPTEQVRDYLGKEEILFLGPDENTADYMDWASLHARKRGYRYWKAFTTGKALQYGGIPHDRYGMTTRSVRAFVTGIQRKEGLDGSKLLKMQTGGPDGDLGSNEILLGNERTFAVVDGSGVLFDPEGINSAELKRLARARKMVKEINKSKLSAKGFLVLVEDKDAVLPDGTVVENGMEFRNHFHLNPIAVGDFFVPCGGRPAAVPLDSVRTFLYSDEEGRSLRFKYVVEGANLFFTQEARLVMEKAGVVVFKDASANKGGVTSSSLEVMAALALNDEEFAANMAVLDLKAIPDFYSTYVAEVQKRVEHNATLEFECLWREHERTGRPRCELTDQLSTKITRLSADIEESDTLWANAALRNRVLRDAVPVTLTEKLGFDVVMERLPENYKRALFGSQLASKFIYENGIETPEFAFYEYVDSLLRTDAAM